VSYNVLDEPCLPCVRTDGASAVVSLHDALVEADTIRHLVVDVPSQFPPLLRLLLTLVHRALADDEGLSGPRSSTEWQQLWRAKRLPADRINRYLADHHDRFDLFHPTAPFLQAAGVLADPKKAKSVSLLVPFAASGNNTPLFSPERDALPRPLPVEEATRWLIHTHAWDTASIKTGAHGDPRAGSAGKTTGNPTGPLGRLGVLIPTGPTLWHTVMYNLLVLDGDLSGPDDLPVWEQPPLTARWRSRPVRGICDLYTWPSRRILLLPEHDADASIRVRRVVVCAGDRMDPPASHRREPHSAWHLSKAAGERTGQAGIYLPTTHQPGRQLWRGMGPMLAHAELTVPTPHHVRPLVLDQLGRIPYASELDADAVTMRLLGVGITYGTQNAVVDETYADELPWPIVLLTSRDWQDTALQAVTAADGATWALGNLASDLARAEGCRDDKLLRGHARGARDRAYAALDGPFRRWLAQLGGRLAEPLPALTEWHTLVRGVVWPIADELLTAVPPVAIRGRSIKRGAATVWMNAPLAEIAFRRILAKAVPPVESDAQTGATA
jgi:CRISPR system Cascade subunit CasA